MRAIALAVAEPGARQADSTNSVNGRLSGIVWMVAIRAGLLHHRTRCRRGCILHGTVLPATYHHCTGAVAVGRDEPSTLDDAASGGDAEKTNRALSLSGVFDGAWVIGNPLASTLAVIFPDCWRSRSPGMVRGDRRADVPDGLYD